MSTNFGKGKKIDFFFKYIHKYKKGNFLVSWLVNFKEEIFFFWHHVESDPCAESFILNMYILHISISWLLDVFRKQCFEPRIAL